MILLIDIGNTATKWGAWDPSLTRVDICEQGYVATADFQFKSISLPQIPVAVYVACVADPKIYFQLQSEIAQAWQVPVYLVRTEKDLVGLSIGYQNVDELGVDRWLNMLAAWNKYKYALMVVSFGTAVTIDMINELGVHLGGVIAPSWKLMVACLTQNTFNIEVKTNLSFELLGDSTETAVNRGAVHAELGVVQEVYGYFAKNWNSNFKCVFTGGEASEFVKHMSIPGEVSQNLVLQGLAVYASCKR